MARISCKARNHNFLRLAPSGKADDALQRKIGVQPVKKRGFPLAGNAGQAVWPASGFSGVRILSGRRGSAPSDNSAKYKDKETGTVSITGRIEGTNILLFVDDDGPGVPDEALPKLFDVFYRNDPSRKKPHQGSGLGLAIVWKTMERMGGTIHAENLSAGGLRMALEIPLWKEGSR